ncbi:MAG: Acetyl-coenzyme A carboxyl transferase beta chain [uncultured Chloroflexia bacterium]|uniref:Multifunctional fusion protein n=1 Tax=uncultured Chloroflexia bacterium TaxID=1672391 RepID=A0A6J4JGP2_9CHLR|nr:MAG: Acetyl-coenzyme A carboxyl transferase beta chain [uncultured Chloroflexia bacterium]
MKTLQDLIHLFQRSHGVDVLPQTEPVMCPTCGASLANQESFRRFCICEHCRHHFMISARRRIELLADPGAFKEDQRRLVSSDPLTFSDHLPYRQRLDEARARTGLLDAVVTGTCTIGNLRVVVAVSDFEFMGGSMGSVVGEKIATAFELALERRLPLITVASSGGARMQEGMLSLVQMAKTSAAAQRLHGAGLPFLSVLTNPTTGGMFASFASLGDITVAEPGALIGFAGPRVVEQTTGIPLPAGSHTAEAQLSYGMIDQIVDRADLREYLIRLLSLLRNTSRRPHHKREEQVAKPDEPDASAWETVRLARRPDRPTTLTYIEHMTTEWTELHGDRLDGDDPAMVCGLAKLDGQTVVVLGHERGADEQERERRNGGRPRPEGFRKVQRVMALAAKFHLPVVTLIDTPGARLDLASESRGLARAIATTMAMMSDLPVPIVSAIIGEGGSGGALALGVADRVLMLEHSIYSVIAPEGAAAIIYRDASRAQEITRALKLTAHDCKFLGVIDSIVPEPEGAAHAAPEEAAQLLKRVLVHELTSIQGRPPAKLVAARLRKFRQMGRFERLSQWDISSLRQRLSARI